MSKIRSKILETSKNSSTLSSRKTVTWTSELATELIDEKIEHARKSFARTGDAPLVSFRDWCDEWDWAQRSDVFTHLVHSYPAKLLPYIPIAFLTSSLAGSDPVLDCFAGTGTVLLECMVHRFEPRSCYGVEINPLGRLIAKAKTTPLSVSRLKTLADDLDRVIAQIPDASISKFTNRDFWFRKTVLKDFAKALAGIGLIDASADERDFFRVCLSAIVRSVSRADEDIAPPVVLKVTNFPEDRQEAIRSILLKKQRAKVSQLLRKKVSDNIARMQSLVELVGLDPPVSCKIVWDDAREMRFGSYVESGTLDKSRAVRIKDSVGMVITSPPYMAAQKYVRTTRLEHLLLALADETDLRSIERLTIGSERATADERRDYIPVENSTADKLLKRAHVRNATRAAIASRYYRDMRAALRAIHLALKPSGVCVMVVGNNSVDGKIMPNHRILSEIAGEAGMFRTELILRDSIRSRGLITKRHSTAGVIDDEHVLVLRKIPVRGIVPA